MQLWRTSPAGSGGLAVRRGAAVALIRDDDPAREALVGAVVEALDAAAEDPTPGRRLARRIAALVSQADPDEVPDLCLLATIEDDGMAALLVGDAELVLDTPTAMGERLSGRDVATWVDRILRPPLHRLEAALDGCTPGPAVSPRIDLRDGVVPAGALVLSLAGAPVAPPAADAPAAPAPRRVPRRAPKRGFKAVPQPATAQPGPPQPVAEQPQAPPKPADRKPAAERSAPAPSLDPATVPDAGDAEVPAQPAPARPAPEPAPAAVASPSSGPAPAPADAASGEAFSVIHLLEGPAAAELAPLPVGDEPEADDAAVVLGISCSRGHFNDPNSSYCASCGISLVHQTHYLVPGRRPALGVLLTDDGGVVPLVGDYVLGREPHIAEAVTDGSALPLVLKDDTYHVSRVHAAIRLHEWDVRVVDLGSANGTYVRAADEDRWTRLVPDEPRTLRSGARVRVGDRILEFDSHRKA